MITAFFPKGGYDMTIHLLVPIARNKKYEEWLQLTVLRETATSIDTICPRCKDSVVFCFCPELLAQEILEEAEGRNTNAKVRKRPAR
jgi:hypothetical protein